MSELDIIQADIRRQNARLRAACERAGVPTRGVSSAWLWAHYGLDERGELVVRKR